MPCMEINDFYTVSEASAGERISFSEQQASDFAKGVAGDFNPIHDPGAKRFCVPGDLLFAVMLHRFGIAANTEVEFAGMLTSGNSLSLPATIPDTLSLADDREREVLSLRMSGTRYKDPQLIKEITTAYVTFSGKTFPDILVPLMRESNAMINPQRPLVIYKDMSISLFSHVDQIDPNNVTLTLDDASLNSDGRKGAVTLGFNIHANEQAIGKGIKNMVLGGLRDFDDDAMQGVVDEYNTRRANYQKPT